VTAPKANRFEDFFADSVYVSLKNHLYNYLLRRRAIRKCLKFQKRGRTLEIGSGLSPMIEDARQIVYSDLSFCALRTLKNHCVRGDFVVADAAHLPFRAGCFTQVVCSEVLEHLPEDLPALREIASALKPEGSLILTFPHRRAYFAGDDRFVNHFRRYELGEMEAKLREVGLETVEVRKVLGPLEKITMLAVLSAMSAFARFGKGRQACGPRVSFPPFVIAAFHWLNCLYCIPVWLDARLSPRSLCSVLLLLAVRGR
jgi:SAM-dependent methyltransferase